MRHEIKEQILKAIENDIANGKSANKVATATGISSAYISKIRNHQWDDKHPSDSTWNKLAAYYSLNSYQLINTRNLQTIKNACIDAKESARFIAISDFTGSGKTTALKHFAQNNGNTHYVLCRASMGRKDFLKAIQQAMAISFEGSINARVQAICHRLNTATTPLLILDDFGKLNDSNMRLIQEIYDETEGHAGIVLGGTEYLKKYIDKMAAKDKLGFRELRRRIGYWQSLSRPTKKEVAALCVNNTISNTSAANAIYTLTNNFGEINELIINAKKAADRKNLSYTAINAAFIEQINFGDTHYKAA